MNTCRLLLTPIVAAVFASQAALAAGDLEALTGKWSVKKTDDQGRDITQVITVKKDKFVFQILGADNQVRLYAEGDLKLEKLGPFSAAHFANIRAGGSASDLQDVDDEYVSIYRLDGDTWIMAANLDKDREGQKPSLDTYHRVKPAAKAGNHAANPLRTPFAARRRSPTLCTGLNSEPACFVYCSSTPRRLG